MSIGDGRGPHAEQTSTEQTVTLTLSRPDADTYRIRFEYGQGYPPESRPVPVGDVADLWRAVRRHYYLAPPEDLEERTALLTDCGQRLFRLLDGRERLLSVHLDRTRGLFKTIILSVDAGEDADRGFAQLPWELLHDGREFLATAARPVIPVRRVLNSARPHERLARPLRLMFMACAPDDDRLADLDYDAENDAVQKIIRQGDPLELDVEDSGELEELKSRLEEYEEDHFDAVHLSGHAGRAPGGGAVFVTEGSRGERVDADADALHDALRVSNPSLLFLSGCRTAAGADVEGADVNATLSLAQQLAFYNSAPVVLGWGRPVSDRAATAAAAAFYEKLARGRTVADGLATTYRSLQEKGDRFWHTLRVFVNGELPGPYVEPKRSARNRSRPRREAETEPTQLGFVGRRRELHEAITVLRGEQAATGVIGLVLCGMGGSGKTWLSQRIQQRLREDFDVVRVEGWLDENVLLDAMRDRGLDLGDVRQDLPLGRRLGVFLDRYVKDDRSGKLLLFDLDNFESAFRLVDNEVASIALVDGRPQTRPEAARALTALVEAISRSGYGHRILMTTRYPPDLPCMDRLRTSYLSAMRPSEIDRVAIRLADGDTALSPSDLVRIVRTAGSNPRLLRSLLRRARAGRWSNLDALQAALRAERVDFLETDILLPMLLAELTAEDRRVLATAAPFEVPVGPAVLARLSGAAPTETERRTRELADLGLLERSRSSGADRFAVPLVLRSEFEARLDEDAMRARYAASARELAAELSDLKGSDRPDPLDVPVLRELKRLALRGGVRELALDAAAALADYEADRLQHAAVQKICEEVLAVWPDDHRINLFLADAHIEQGRSGAEPLFQRALQCCPPDKPSERAGILLARGFWRYNDHGRDALRDLDEVIDLASTGDLTLTLAAALRCRARVLADLDSAAHRAEIAGHLAMALDLVDGIPDAELERSGVLLDRAIALHLEQNDIEDAERDLESALRLDEQAGAVLAQGIALLTMAEAALTRCRRARLDTPEHSRYVNLAEDKIDDALERTRLHRIAVKAALLRGSVAEERYEDARARRDHVRARAFLEQARATYQDGLGLAHESERLRSEQAALLGLRWFYEQTGDTAKLDEVRRDLETVARQLGSPEDLIDNLVESLGRIDAATASTRAREAATLAAAVGNDTREVEAWELFVDSADAADLPIDQVEAPLRRLLALLPPDDVGRRARFGYQLSHLLLRAERLADAEPVLELTLRHYQRLGVHGSSAQLHERLSEVARGRRDPVKAEAHLQAAALERLRVRGSEAAAQTLRTLAGVQRDRSASAAVRSLVLARRLARITPSGRAEQAVLDDLAVLAARPDTAPTLVACLGVSGATPEALRHEAGDAERRARPLQLAVGSDLEGLVDPERGGRFLADVDLLRLEINREDGWWLPGVAVTADPDLGPRECAVRVWDALVRRGQIDFTSTADATALLLGWLRHVARQYRAELTGPEPAPVADPALDRLSAADVVARLRGGWNMVGLDTVSRIEQEGTA